MERRFGPSKLLNAASTGHLEAVGEVLSDPLVNINDRDITGKTALWLAVERENNVAVEILIKAGADLDKTCLSRQTALMLSTIKGNSKLLSILITSGSGLDFQDSYGMTALMVAAQRGFQDCLKILIGANADVNLYEIRGSTAVMLAVEEGHPECLKMLIEAGASIIPPDSRGLHPLISAVARGFEECALILIEAGAEVDVSDKRRMTSLMTAVEVSSSCLPLLINAGANLDLQDRRGKSALMLAAHLGKTKELKYLLEANANMDTKDDQGTTALMLAAGMDRKECVDLMLEHNVNFSIGDDTGKTAPMIAAFNSHHACLQSFQEHGCRDWTDLKCKRGRTALMYASMAGCQKCLSILIDSGANLDLADCRDLTAVMFLISEAFDKAGDPSTGSCMALSNLSSCFLSNIKDCLQILIDAGADLQRVDRLGQSSLTLTSQSSQEGSSELLAMMLHAGADIELADVKGNTALAHACFRGLEENVELLVESKANVNSCDKTGKTPLIHAAENSWHKRSIKCILCLLDHGADINTQDNEGKTALMYATLNTVNINTINILVSRGARLDMIDNLGGSALVYALGSGHEAIEQVKFFLQHGADPNTGCISGHSAVAIALSRNNQALFELLIQYQAQLSIKWEIVRSLVSYGHKEILQSVISNGAVPSIEHPGSDLPSNMDKFSYMSIALNSNQIDLAKYFIATCCLNDYDVRLRPQPFSGTMQIYRVSRSMIHNVEEKNQILKIYNQPWPLVKLCFVAVSSIMGPSPGREERVRKSQLPPRLQRMLMFQEPVSKLCWTKWSAIPLCFDPVQYDCLPTPRPLLYHWPVGHQLVACDCDVCGQCGFKFSC